MPANDPKDALKAEYSKVEEFLAGRGKDSQLVTKGQILNAPFTSKATYEEQRLAVTISGVNDSVTITCNRIIKSPYRYNLLSFFTTSEGNVVSERRFIAGLAPAYQRILAAFPPDSKFDTGMLYAKIRRLDGGQQAHARRRWKELKYNYGFDVDYGRVKEGNKQKYIYWRGPSETPVRDPFPRPDDKKLRDALLPVMLEQLPAGVRPTCNYCGVPISFDYLEDVKIEEDEGGDSPSSAEDRQSPALAADADVETEPGLIDHRRPIYQSGDDIVENLQFFCQTCNNKKSTACRRCAFDYKCDGCIWAHPEEVRTRRLVLIMDAKTADQLNRRFGQDAEKIAVEIIKDSLKTN
ncbi:MAG: hypothetical protein JWQ87_3869 [Candidatus Sulfotelmatobacter sp.]|nr:hypothetical protein [Candidatus Sulfotelmatobacter sp.]